MSTSSFVAKAPSHTQILMVFIFIAAFVYVLNFHDMHVVVDVLVKLVFYFV